MNKSSVQLLIATMNQKESDYSLLEKMNVQSDAIVCNQCGRYSYERIEWKGWIIDWYNFDEKGVGLNRNNALMRASADIVVFCDDDMVLVNDYARLLTDGFKTNSKADILIYNLEGRKENTKVSRVNWSNYLRYGAARIAARRTRLKENGILFNLCFGGGTEHQHGEDNIFLCDCLKKGLKLYTYPIRIGCLVDDRPSTWRKNYDNRFFIDQGALYRQISRKHWKMLCLIDSVKHQKRYSCSWYSAYKQMISREVENIEA